MECWYLLKSAKTSSPKPVAVICKRLEKSLLKRKPFSTASNLVFAFASARTKKTSSLPEPFRFHLVRMNALKKLKTRNQWGAAMKPKNPVTVEYLIWQIANEPANPDLVGYPDEEVEEPEKVEEQDNSDELPF